MHKLTLIAVLATAALAAGCGGNSGKTLTKAEVIKQGSAICKSAEKRVETLPQLTVEAHANAAFQLFEKASSQTKRYGFPHGVCQAGDT